jgi:hypothetical protein
MRPAMKASGPKTNALRELLAFALAFGSFEVGLPSVALDVDVGRRFARGRPRARRHPRGA